jgi:alkylation response protein AidB-like acyl-CoA dehydrogenase
MGETTAQDRERELVEWAAKLGAEIRPYVVEHDRDGTFVTEAFTVLRDAGYLALAVPEELGGRGATIRQVAMAQRELARHCASTALASTMHHHIVLFTAWRWRRELPGAEALLRRIVDENLLLVSTGGADFTRPRGEAVKVDGGYRVSGTKIFASQSPVGNVMSTMFPYDDPDEGRIVLNTAVPLSAEGVSVLDNWNAMGMRGTGSGDIELTDVFVPDDKIAARRPYGVLDPVLQAVVAHALPPIIAVYLGVAESARDEAVAAVTGTAKAEDPGMQRRIGLMETRLRVAAWALDGALAVVGDDPTPSQENVSYVMAAKRAVSEAAIEACDLAMEAVGGSAYFKGNAVERAYRDVRGIKFHPLDPEAALLHTGKLTLGLPVDAM